MDKSAIDDFENGGRRLVDSLAGLTEDDLLKIPADGSWSIKQIVVHMLDSDLVGADRMKRVIAENNPTLLAYDETAFANSLFYQQADVKLVCDIFRMNRQYIAAILRQVPEACYLRFGQHTESGQKTLEDLIRNYIEHLNHHLRFIYRKRSDLGKPLANA
jgi:uncharacterized damage-inducible protein DinB